MNDISTSCDTKYFFLMFIGLSIIYTFDFS
jgi:hypothetical protein